MPENFLVDVLFFATRKSKYTDSLLRQNSCALKSALAPSAVLCQPRSLYCHRILNPEKYV